MSKYYTVKRQNPLIGKLRVVSQFEIKRPVIPKRGINARGIYFAAVEKSRFLADKPGFGMTSLKVLCELSKGDMSASISS
jgi:hypothetical protein